MKVSQLCGKEISLNHHPFPYNDFVGVEIEVENVNSGWLNLTGCRLDSEGSVRNGFEVVTEVMPASKLSFIVRTILTQIEDWAMENELEESDVFGERTSIHVHLNMSDVDVDEVKKLIVIYKAFEPLIMAYHGDRQYSRFCTPLYSTDTRYMSAHNAIHRIGSKYMALNTKTLGRFGTVEFRHMRGTYSYPAVEEWVGIILSLKQMAVANSWEEIEASITSGSIFNKMPEHLLEALGSDEGLKLEGMAHASAEIQVGHRQAVSNATESDRLHEAMQTWRILRDAEDVSVPDEGEEPWDDGDDVEEDELEDEEEQYVTRTPRPTIAREHETMGESARLDAVRDRLLREAQDRERVQNQRRTMQQFFSFATHSDGTTSTIN